MKTKLIMVEGLPGSGKTTIAGKIKDYYERQGTAVRLYAEGDLHPADLGWCACIPLHKFVALLKECPQYADAIRANTRMEDDYAVVAYTKTGIDDPTLTERFAAWEFYDGRVPRDLFLQAHRRRWQAFGKKAAGRDKLTIFECAYLQNHVNELLLFYKAAPEELLSHLTFLAQVVGELEPLLLYLDSPDAAKTIGRAARQRLSPTGEQVWFDRVVRYIAGSPYGQAHGLSGADGAAAYFTRRRQLELELLPKLPVKSAVIPSEGDWEQTWNTVAAELATIE